MGFSKRGYELDIRISKRRKWRSGESNLKLIKSKNVINFLKTLYSMVFGVEYTTNQASDLQSQKWRIKYGFYIMENVKI